MVTLAPALDSPAALYRKLEREAYRAFHARSRTHKADHFFNFCVTAHSMRDYFLKHFCIEIEKERYHKEWNDTPVIVAARDIANSSKHFALSTKQLTRAVRLHKSKFATILVSREGQLKILRAEGPDVSIRLSDGTTLSLYAFTSEVLNYWKGYLGEFGIRVRRQSLAKLVEN